jgi:hypothetical protein
MNNVDSLFFRGIYQVGVPITRSFRSVVPPGKMRPEIAMHLCALVEDEDQREGLLPLRPLPWPFPVLRFALPFGILPFPSSPLSLSPFLSAIFTLSPSLFVSDPPRTCGTPRVSPRETVS